MRSDFILNVDVSSSRKFSLEEFDFCKEEMESDFPYNEFSLILLENLELKKNGILEIYIEDLEMEFDLTEDIESILPGIDQYIKAGKGSRIEWYSSRGVCNVIWTKGTSGWKRSEEDGDPDFFEESFFGFED
jgi:hypothetical protein